MKSLTQIIADNKDAVAARPTVQEERSMRATKAYDKLRWAYKAMHDAHYAYVLAENSDAELQSDRIEQAREAYYDAKARYEKIAHETLYFV